MKERPILFSSAMVRAILDGRKTQTRRVIPQKVVTKNAIASIIRGGELGFSNCPYGQAGDRLWVRETHYRFGHWNKNGFTKTGKQKWTFKPANNEVRYFDNPPNDVKPNRFRGLAWYKRPSIFMPRWASRITLEITNVRVERVQDIRWRDVQAEGVCLDIKGIHGMTYDTYAQNEFGALWDSINAKRGYGWDKNPWVWVIEFKRLEDVRDES